jgi:YbgC/YbaW family acyl-CoA thioester hydrolase
MAFGSGEPARQQLLEGPARFVEKRVVRFQDIDAAGIVFFPRLLEYFHDAYVSYLTEAGCPMPPVIAEAKWGIPLRHCEAEFLRPLRFGDEIDVVLVQAVLRESGFSLGHRIAMTKDPARPVMLGRTVHVTIDRQTFKRIPLPGSLRAALAKLA